MFPVIVQFVSVPLEAPPPAPAAVFPVDVQGVSVRPDAPPP